jgi:ATP-binding cassette subfamily F protein uup
VVFEGAGRWQNYVGGYTDWLRQRKSAAPPPAAKAARTKREATPAPPRRVSFKEQRELADLPATIEKLEAEKQGLFALMASPGFYATQSDEVARVKEQLAGVEAAIHKAYARWAELEARTTSSAE